MAGVPTADLGLDGRDWQVDLLARALGMAVLGVLVLAVLTSLPNAFTGVRLGLQRRGSALLAETLNSNTINLVAGVAIPALLLTLGSYSGLVAFDLAWLIGTTLVVLALLGAHHGFEVVGEPADGEEALASVEALRPDLVLLDVWMPRLDGIAATARIKARWPSMRVVVHSLATERSDDALAAGADASVPKGAPTEELLSALRAAGPDPQRPS